MTVCKRCNRTLLNEASHIFGWPLFTRLVYLIFCGHCWQPHQPEHLQVQIQTRNKIKVSKGAGCRIGTRHHRVYHISLARDGMTMVNELILPVQHIHGFGHLSYRNYTRHRTFTGMTRYFVSHQSPPFRVDRILFREEIVCVVRILCTYISININFTIQRWVSNYPYPFNNRATYDRGEIWCMYIVLRKVQSTW